IRQVVRQPEEKLYWQITRVQPVRIAIVEAFWSGKKYSTKTWYGDYLFGRDPFRERGSKPSVMRLVPHLARLQQRVRYPNVRIRRGIAVRHAPLVVGTSAP